MARLRARGTKCLMAMGTMGLLLASPAFINNKIASIFAMKPVAASAKSWQAPQQPNIQKFEIPAGNLDSVLTAFQKVTGLRVAVSNSAINEISSPGVNGTYSSEEALKVALIGTGVTYKFTNAQEIALELESVSDVIEVRSSVQILSSPKYAESLLNTPQSISVVSQQTIQEQGITTLREVLKNVAGISIAAGEGGAQGDNLTIRGFAARNDLFLDGMRDFGSYYRDPFNIEEVAVLKGPASVNSGRGSTGGVVNQSTKTPGLRQFISGTLEFGSDQTKRVTLDVNQPITKLGNGAAFRLNLLANDNEVAGRNAARQRRFGIAPSLALGLGTPTRFTVTYLHQSSDDIPDYGIPFLFDRPAPVPRETYYGFKNNNFLKTNVDVLTARIEHDFGEHLTVRNQARYANYTRDVFITEARTTGTITPTTPLDKIMVSLNEITVDSEESFLQDQLDITSKFKTGFLKYTLVGGFEVSRESSKPKRFTYTGVPNVPLLNPDEDRPFSGTAMLTSKVRGIGNSAAAYILGTIKVAEKVELTGAVRFDRFDVDYNQFIGANAGFFSRRDDLTSYRGALVFHPIANSTLYVSYGNSFNPSAESLTLSASNANLPPEENQNYEAGAKFEILNRKIQFGGAVFKTDKINARETDPTNSLLTVLSGKQRAKGFEFQTAGRFADRWSFILGYAYVDSEVVESRFFPKAVGSVLANVPKNNFTFSTTYQLPWRITAGANGQYLSRRTASSTVPIDPITGFVKEVPGYFTMNLMASRPISDRLSVQVNVYNIADKFYIDQVSSGRLVPGQGRSVKVGLNFKL